jgi:hypothetical protein
MNSSVLKFSLGIVMTSALAVSGAAAGIATAEIGTAEKLKQDYPRPHTEIWFKLAAGGQFDAAAGTASFAGQGSHVGQFTTSGPINPWGGIESSLISASGDTLFYYMFFAEDQPGDLQAYFQLVGGTGRFSNFYGRIHGPATMDEDGMFTMSVSGRITIPIIDP